MENGKYEETDNINSRTAIQSPDLVLTYGQLAEICGMVSRRLEGRNLVFHVCSNTVEAISGYVAFLGSGQVQMLLNEDLDQGQLDRLMALYCPRYLYIPLSRTYAYPAFRVLFHIGAYVLLETDFSVQYEIHDSLALLLTTSGSTGSRRFVRLSYQNVRSNAEAIAEYLELDREERPALILPINYTYGLSIINSHLLTGAALLLPGKKVFQKAFWDFFTEKNATSISGTPYVYEMLSKSGFLHRRFPSLRMMTQAGGKLSEGLHKKFAGYAEDNGVRFYAMYGQTEATARMAYLPYQLAMQKCGSIGKAIPGGRLALADDCGKEILDVYTVGEIIYYGPNVSLGYAEGYEDLRKGDERQGRLCTGDLGMRDEDGFYYITGRKKRIIKMFGKRISLDETEMLLKNQFPEVDCCCGGKDDELTLVTDEKEEEKQSRMKAFLASRLKVPSVFVTVKYKEQLPRTESGKIRYDQI